MTEITEWLSARPPSKVRAYGRYAAKSTRIFALTSAIHVCRSVDMTGSSGPVRSGSSRPGRFPAPADSWTDGAGDREACTPPPAQGVCALGLARRAMLGDISVQGAARVTHHLAGRHCHRDRHRVIARQSPVIAPAKDH